MNRLIICIFRCIEQYASQIYPAVCFYYYFCAEPGRTANPTPTATAAAAAAAAQVKVDAGTRPCAGASGTDKLVCACCFVSGVASFAFCIVGAFGQVLSPTLRGAATIGCASWGL